MGFLVSLANEYASYIFSSNSLEENQMPSNLTFATDDGSHDFNDIFEDHELKRYFRGRRN